MNAKICLVFALLGIASFARAIELPIGSFDGRTGFTGEKCNLSISEAGILVTEAKFNFFHNEYRIVRKVQIKDLSKRFDGFRPTNGLPYTTFSFSKKMLLNHLKQQIWIYYDAQGGLISVLAAQQVTPTFAPMQTTVVECFFN